MSNTILVDVLPTTDTLTELLVALGVEAEQLDSELDLMIDEFDQWTNLRSAVPNATSSVWYETGAELQQVA